MIVTASNCLSASGSIRNIRITNGSTYRWINMADNSNAGTTPDLFNASPGNYVLTITNSYGCAKSSPVITVPPSSFEPIAVASVAVTNALCSKNTGSVIISSFTAAATDYTFRWTDSASGHDISDNVSINNLAPGTYRLFAKDNKGCEQNIYDATIVSTPPPVIDYGASVIANDECRLMQGGVSLKITGLSGPTSYTWYDENENIVGTGINLQNIAAGAYTVTVTDAIICSVHSDPFVVGNDNSTLPPPAYDDVIIPGNTDAIINIKNPAPGNYTLYAEPGGIQPVFQNTDGNFIISLVNRDTVVYIKRSKGFCYSTIVAVHISVVNKSYFTIPTAFTPNGDNVNDKLSVKGIGITMLDYFRIYNQWGKLVFETNRLNTGWDGRINGVSQNTAAFVWIARGKDLSGRTISDKGTFVLIH
jgi:gliding motility-associated-like protein